MINLLIKHLSNYSKICLCGLEGSALAYILAKLQNVFKRPFLIISPDIDKAQKLSEALNFFLSSKIFSPFEQKVFLLPEESFLPYTGISPRPEIIAKQFNTLFGLLNIENPIVITTPRMLMSFFMPINVFKERTQIYEKGEELERGKFINFLQTLGYEHLSIVESPGEFSVRGNIIDIFCPLYFLPLRLEFFGDILESIRLFNPVTQRSEYHLNEFILIPANPIPYQEDAFKKAYKRFKIPILEAPLHQPGIEDFFPLFYEKINTLFDYLPKETIFCLLEPENIEKRAEEFEKKLKIHLEELSHEKRPYLPFELTAISFKTIKNEIKFKKQILIYSLPILKKLPTVEFKSKMPFSHILPKEKYLYFRSYLENWLKEGYSINLVASDKYNRRQLTSLIESWGFSFSLKTSPLESAPGINIYCGNLSEGFEFPEEKVVFLGENDWRTKERIVITKNKEDFLPVSSFEDLKEGDLLVHVEHGIGRYIGLKTITSGGITGDFLVIEYQGGDKLYLPVDRLHLVHKYRGIEDKIPSLDRLGGRTWNRTKQQVKKAVEKVAKELLELYAKRLAQPGYAFSPPDSLFYQFVESFPYPETPDQQRSINEILEDMMCPHPMERLLCGDVGFGKTEVAIRAAFKAVLDGKQVAVLVPTTILAEQHYLTFKERLKDFPVNIACLSRFRSSKEQKDILQRLKKGEIDIIIGTHRILQKDVIFKDLGLLIIDEEHRFGVRQKEHLKTLKSNVDVLSLSATPIPRTLYLSLLGIRDLSLIETPPPGRRPIMTYLAKFNPLLIKDVIKREVERGGQVFFVHPRVKGIPGLARFLKKLLPEIRLGIAHGQMSERKLENEMLKFLKHEIDVLLCTNIIESGLDIPNANTIIINRADLFGLAQLYHLRGRVGRSYRQAYAYLLVPGKKLITKEAQKRLRALLTYTELSSGYKLALYDLKLRGAGQILGTAQSGHIAAVGYEMYLELLQKAVKALKGESLKEEIEPELKLPIMAYIPESYVPDENQRIIFYRRLSKVKDEEELKELEKEMIDRYGQLPKVVENLFQLLHLKLFCRQFRISRLYTKNGWLKIVFEKETPISSEKMVKFLSERPSYRFNPKGELEIPLRHEDILKKAKKVLVALKEVINV